MFRALKTALKPAIEAVISSPERKSCDSGFCAGGASLACKMENARRKTDEMRRKKWITEEIDLCMERGSGGETRSLGAGVLVDLPKVLL
jgi:hypothetical protein